jgi:hypothetical protein
MDPPAPPPVDLLSSLPVDLQDKILTRLDLRDVVRTSALSSAWRRRWETIPGLVLSFPDGTPTASIYCVLLRYAGPSVSGFVTNIDGRDKASTTDFDDCLIALSRRNVESISVANNRRAGTLSIHSSIFSCVRLDSLSLERCCIPPLPRLQPQPQPGGGFAGFPVLKELYLKFVFYADGGEGLRAMIRASPMLRVLHLEEVLDTYMDCVIEAPNLHTLGVISDCYVVRFEKLPRLQCASINVVNFYDDECIIEFLTAVSHIEELIFNIQVHCLIAPIYCTVHFKL